MENKGLKITIIGSGSTYTPEIIEGFINKRDALPVRELYLMDIDERKLNIVGGLCKRMVEAVNLDCKVVLTQDLDEAIKGADFVMAQIRVGKLPARVLDEKIPLKYDLIGQETNGIGGFFKGMRTIPAILNITKHMEELCPNAWLINFSNPSGMIAEAVLNNTKIKMMGLCNVPINMIDSVKKRLNLKEAEIEYVGLNHLSWITSIVADGKDYLQTAIKEGINSEAMKNIPASGFTPELIKTIGAIPTSYLEYYYYKDKKLENAKNVEKSRGEVCMEIEENLLEIYSNSEVHTKPELLSKRGGSRYSEVAINLVDSIYNDRGDIQVVNILNKGAIEFMDDNDAVEICARIDKNGATPIKTHFKNDHIKEYMLMMKAYEKHAVKAALTGDVDEAMRALLINPLVGDYKSAYPCFKELLKAHKTYLPQFKDE
jgi:6-phospho-beta-glucosidase